MTEQKLKRQLKSWAALYFAEVFKNAPVRTGELRSNIVTYTYGNKFGLMIDVEHMKYTEEAWTYNKRWGKTLPNPNEKWLLATVEFIIEQARLKGGIVK